MAPTKWIKQAVGFAHKNLAALCYLVQEIRPVKKNRGIRDVIISRL